MNHYIFMALCLLSLPLHAQNMTEKSDSILNRTVIVEQDFTPDIIDANKINLLPQAEIIKPTNEKVDYATASLPAKHIPSDQMDAYTVPIFPQQNKVAYFRLGYGTHNNVDATAHYYGLIGKDNLLEAQIEFSGIKTKLNDLINTGEKWKSHFYRTKAAIDYTHIFKKISFKLGGDFRLSNFNTLEKGYQNSQLQKFTNGNAHILLSSNENHQNIEFKVGTGFTGYSRKSLNNQMGTKEWQLHTIFELKALVTDNQSFKVSADMENLFYNSIIPSQVILQPQTLLDNRTLININPYYEVTRQKFNIHIGLHTDFSIGSGTILRASPDIHIKVPFSKKYVFFVQATGGRIFNDLQQIETINPYASLYHSLKDTYEQANVNIGLRANPISEFWFNVYGGYQNIKNDTYTSFNESPSTYYTALNQTHTSNWYATIQASYNIKDIWSISLESTFQDWKATKTAETTLDIVSGQQIQETWNPALVLKPRVECNVNMSLHPIPNLLLNVNYQFRRHEDRSHKAQNFLKIRDVNNLNCNLTYNITDWLSAFVKADNILNKHYQTYLLIPDQGFSFMGGLSGRF